MARLWTKASRFTAALATLSAAGCTTIPSAQQLQADAALASVPPPDGETQRPSGSPKSNLLKLARDIENRGSVGTALPLYERAAESADAGAEVHAALGNAYSKLGRDDEASNSFRRALAQEPAYPLALFGLGSVLIRSGQVEKGLEMLAAAAPRLNSSEAYDRLGVAHILAGQPREALASFEQAYSLANNNPDIATNLSLAAALLSQYSRAVSLAQQTLNYPDVKPYHRRNLILALAISGKTEEARLARGSQAVSSAEMEALIERAAAIRQLSDPKDRALALGAIRVAAAQN